MKKNVQHAKEEKPNPEVEPVASEEKSKEAIVEPQPVEVAAEKEAAAVDSKEAGQTMGKLIEIPQVDEDTKKMLAKAGFSWESFEQAFERVNLWAEGVEKKFSIIFEKMPTEKGIADQVTQNLVQMAEKQKMEMAERMKNQPQQQSGIGGDVATKLILQAIAGGGGGDNPFQQKINDFTMKILDRALEKAAQPSRFEQLFEEELMKAKAKALAAVVNPEGA